MREGTVKLCIYDHPDTAPISVDYMVTVNGQPVHVYDSEAAAYVCWAFEGAVTVRVAVRENHEDIVVRPHAAAAQVSWQGSVATISLDQPAHLCFDPPYGRGRKPLFIYANALESSRPDPTDPRVHFFEAGKIHEAGLIRLCSGETLYIEGGAIVRGSIEATNAQGIRVAGHGILDGGGVRRNGKKLSHFYRCQQVAISGIIMVGTPGWTIMLQCCEECRVVDVKQIGWIVCSDGIDIVGSRDVLVENCCLRNNDDCVVIKAFDGPKASNEPLVVENVEVRNCIFYNADAGNVMEIGFELRGALVRNVHFHDCDVIAAHGEGGVFTIHNGDRALVRDITYERIRVEHYYDRVVDFRVLHSRYSRDPQRGAIRGVVLRDITAAPNGHNNISLIGGWDSEHLVEDITFENVRVGGKHMRSSEEMQLFVNSHVRGVTFR